MDENENPLEDSTTVDNSTQSSDASQVTEDAPQDSYTVSVQQIERIEAHLTNIQCISVVSMVGVGLVAGLLCSLIFAMFFRHL